MSTSESSRRSSVLSAQSQPSSHSSHHSENASFPGLIIPSSGGGSIGDIGGFQLPSEQPSSVQGNERLGRLLEDDGEAFNFDPGFSFDAEGNLIEEPLPQSVEQAPEVRAASESATSRQVRQAVSENQIAHVSEFTFASKVSSN